MTVKKKENPAGKPTARKKEVAPAAERSSTEEFPDELREPLWSVVSFEKCEAGGLTYPEAEQKINELEAQGVAGLCIVTDEAAARISRKT